MSLTKKMYDEIQTEYNLELELIDADYQYEIYKDKLICNYEDYMETEQQNGN